MNNNVRHLVREGMKGKGGKLGNSVTITTQVDGKPTARFDIPCEQPQAVLSFLQQCVGAMATAATEYPKKQLVLGVAPRWKAWVIKHLLRAI